MPICATRGTPSGMDVRRTLIAHHASSTASTVPIVDSSTLSTISCRMSRQRPAPSAARIPTSRSRVVARASSRFATFAQAISRTMPTAPSSMSIHDLVFAPTR